MSAPPEDLVEQVAQLIYETITEGPWPGPWAVWATTLDQETFRGAARAVLAKVQSK